MVCPNLKRAVHKICNAKVKHDFYQKEIEMHELGGSPIRYSLKCFINEFKAILQ